MMIDHGKVLAYNNQDFARSLEKVKDLYFRMYSSRGLSENTKRRYDKEVDKKISKFHTEKK